MLSVVFFASVRERLGVEKLELEWDACQYHTVNSLQAHLLASQPEHWEAVLGDRQLLVAVNQSLATEATLLHDGDEVAFFPPVTGG